MSLTASLTVFAIIMYFAFALWLDHELFVSEDSPSLFIKVLGTPSLLVYVLVQNRWTAIFVGTSLWGVLLCVVSMLVYQWAKDPITKMFMRNNIKQSEKQTKMRSEILKEVRPPKEHF